jgi:hypothetical protein
VIADALGAAADVDAISECFALGRSAASQPDRLGAAAVHATCPRVGGDLLRFPHRRGLVLPQQDWELVGVPAGQLCERALAGARFDDAQQCRLVRLRGDTLLARCGATVRRAGVAVELLERLLLVAFRAAAGRLSRFAVKRLDTG